MFSHWLAFLILSLVLLMAPRVAAQAVSLEAGFAAPPPEARLRAYWWWLNGNVTKAAITRDLEAMKAQGFGGALICDAGGAEQRNNDPVPHGPDFLSAEWRELYRHTLREAARLGLELSLNIQSGWNLGGPMVTADDTAKKLTWSEIGIESGGAGKITLPAPQTNDGYYRDVRVLAWPINPEQSANRPPLKNYLPKALIDRPALPGANAWLLANSSPNTAPVFAAEELETPGEADALSTDVLDLTDRLALDGTLDWQVPPGSWRVLRLGATLCEHREVSTSSDGWKGYAIDVLDRGALQRYWDAVVAPLIADAGPLAGTTLRYLHTDSWEVDAFNWTPTAIEEFKRRRGYDPLPWLPVLSGRIINNRTESNRFLHDYRRTLGDLAIDNHFKPFSELAARHGLGIHPESGGPHFTPIDAQQALAINDIPMAEFWASSAMHRTEDPMRFFVKQPASAAHTAGHPLVAAEGFTTIGPHWQETLWDNLKPAFDQASVEGLNRLVWHAFVCSPATMGVPGQQYFAGTHLNPNVTWWGKSAPFFAYLNRVQFMLQRGLPVSDVLYYYGNDVPNFTQLRASDPAQVGAGYDYDVIALEQLLTRVTVRDGRLVLPEGTSYRALVLPAQSALALPALQKIKELVDAGAAVIGPKPDRTLGLTDWPAADREVQRIAAEVWPRVQAGKTAREALLAAGVLPDFSFTTPDEKTKLNYIHRREGDTDIYFVTHRAKQTVSAQLTFRVAGKVPELWDAVTGKNRFATDYLIAGGRTTVSVELPPCGSLFVVFRAPAAQHAATGQPNMPQLVSVATLAEQWSVEFDPRWGGPAAAMDFSALTDWTKRAEEGIRYYSGTAIYRQRFDAGATGATVLDLGEVHELASVKLNGQSLGIVWAPPFQLDIAGLLKPTGNELEIEVVNFWANRVIGDEARPVAERFTKTNVRTLTSETPLMRSGLLGPVQLLQAETRSRKN